MLKAKKLHVKVGDNVKIISGFDKNKTGQVTKIYRNTGKILVKKKFEILALKYFLVKS